MKSQWIILISIYALTRSEDDLLLISKTHSAHLEKYAGYVSAIILNFKVPDDSNFASFKFQAEEVALSFFACQPQSVSVYLKQGAPPVINPDGSKFSPGFLNMSSRPALHFKEFKSNNKFSYINITSPLSGLYFIAAFITYTDPRDDRITQQGLTADCSTFLNAALYVKHKPTPHVIASDKNIHVLLPKSKQRLYKFFVPEIADNAILSIKDINFCENCTELLVKIQPYTVPGPNNSLHDIQLKKENYDSKAFSLRFMTLENCWYYIEFLFMDAKNDSVAAESETGQFIFKLKYFSSFVLQSNDTQDVKTEALVENGTPLLSTAKENDSILFKHAVLRNYKSPYLDYNVNYKQYNLIKEGHSESFTFSFDLPPSEDGITPIAINVTNKDVYVLKFLINPGFDIGGTIQYGLAFKPRIKTVGKMRMFDDEPEGHTIVGCIRSKEIEIPTWPNKCTYNEKSLKAPIILNKTVDNNTVYIPFPEAGIWYASFKLFCGGCEKCKCTENCKKMYRTCAKNCETQCENSSSCDLCVEDCEQLVISKSECSNCDCEGPCQKSDVTCSSSVIFAVASYPCVNGKCGKNGKCLYLVSEGLAYSVCVCTNNYRGWDCSDDSYANSRAMIILELLLLTLSNLVFLPAVYVAYRREFYVEALVYFSTCFFSTFYHACDAGERVYSFCLVRLAVLQFSDFFSGLLSIWVTVIAMAYLPYPWPSICHIGGAILLAFGTTVNKTSLMVFTVPSLTGIAILIASWYIRYRKTGMRFPSKRYLYLIFPTGMVVVGVGLITFALLQTQSNYKYLHSIWHILMAVSIIILLPNKRTFLPPTEEAIE